MGRYSDLDVKVNWASAASQLCTLQVALAFPKILISVPMAHILIIEDDRELRETLRALMIAEGHSVTSACSGQEARVALDWKQPPDLVITDIYMPDRDGLEVINDLRHQQLNTKIIAISGGGGAGVLAMASALGASQVLAKPFQPEELIEVVKKVLWSSSPRAAS